MRGTWALPRAQSRQATVARPPGRRRVRRRPSELARAARSRHALCHASPSHSGCEGVFFVARGRLGVPLDGRAADARFVADSFADGLASSGLSAAPACAASSPVAGDSAAAAAPGCVIANCAIWLNCDCSRFHQADASKPGAFPSSPASGSAPPAASARGAAAGSGRGFSALG
jgi:hypothetical protein